MPSTFPDHDAYNKLLERMHQLFYPKVERFNTFCETYKLRMDAFITQNGVVFTVRAWGGKNQVLVRRDLSGGHISYEEPAMWIADERLEFIASQDAIYDEYAIIVNRANEQLLKL